MRGYRVLARRVRSLLWKRHARLGFVGDEWRLDGLMFRLRSTLQAIP